MSHRTYLNHRILQAPLHGTGVLQDLLSLPLDAEQVLRCCLACQLQYHGLLGVPHPGLSELVNLLA